MSKLDISGGGINLKGSNIKIDTTGANVVISGTGVDVDGTNIVFTIPLSTPTPPGGGTGGGVVSNPNTGLGGGSNDYSWVASPQRVAQLYQDVMFSVLESLDPVKFTSPNDVPVLVSQMTSNPTDTLINNNFATMMPGTTTLTLTTIGRIFVKFWTQLYPTIPLPVFAS